MARPTTEIVILPLKSGVDIDDADSPAGKVVNDTISVLMQQEGVQRAYKGLHVENPTILELHVDWDSIDAHKKFMSQTYYGPTIKHLLSIVDGELDVYHANFSVHPPSSALNPNAALATEVVGHYFSADLSDSEKSTWESDLDKFAKVLEENAQGYRGFLGGWVVEEQEHKEVDGKTILWLSLLGWDSVEAHMAFRETDAFKDNVHLMRPDFKKASTLHHVKFQPV